MPTSQALSNGNNVWSSSGPGTVFQNYTVGIDAGSAGRISGLGFTPASGLKLPRYDYGPTNDHGTARHGRTSHGRPPVRTPMISTSTGIPHKCNQSGS